MTTKANDPIVRGTSKVLSATPDYDELYTSVADSWRISQQESLLDYIEDQTTAEATCKAGGSWNLELLKNCAFDLASTGWRRSWPDCAGMAW